MVSLLSHMRISLSDLLSSQLVISAWAGRFSFAQVAGSDAVFGPLGLDPENAGNRLFWVHHELVVQGNADFLRFERLEDLYLHIHRDIVLTGAEGMSAIKPFVFQFFGYGFFSPGICALDKGGSPGVEEQLQKHIVFGSVQLIVSVDSDHQKDEFKGFPENVGHKP